MGMSVHRNSVHGYQQIDSVDGLIDRMGSAPVKVQCANDKIFSNKTSGDCNVSDEKRWVQAHDFELPDLIEVPRFKRERRRPYFVDIPELLGVPL